MIPEIEAHLAQMLPNATTYGFKFELGPGANGKIRARLIGPDRDVLRELSKQTIAIMEDDGGAKAIRTDWFNRVKVVVPQVAEEQANLNGIERKDIAAVLREGFQGESIGVYRERDLLLPIVERQIP